MLKSIVGKILTNGFLLLIPIFLWNIVFANKLPESFQAMNFDLGIAKYIIISENILRLIVFVLPLMMTIRLNSTSHKIGLLIYIIGVFIYYSSWLILIYFPESRWSTNLLGYMAPAYTPLIWLIGIGLTGDSLYLHEYFHWIYFISSIFFVSIHSYHTYLVY